MADSGDAVLVDCVEGFIRVRTEGFKLWFVIYHPQYLSYSLEGQLPMLVIHGGPGMPHGYLKECCLGASAANCNIHHRSIIFYDQLGCGHSDKPPGEHHYSLALSVDDLHCLVCEIARRAGADAGTGAGVSAATTSTDSPSPLRLHLLGHSFGGMLAYEYIRPNHYKTNILCPVHFESLVLLSTPTSTHVSMEASLRCKQKIIGDMVSANMGCASFVAMEDLDVRAAQKFMDTHMYRRPHPRGDNSEGGSVSERILTLPTLESLIDRTVPSWDGVHTRDLREWAAWEGEGADCHATTTTSRGAHSVDQPSVPHSLMPTPTASAQSVTVTPGSHFPVCLITGQHDFVNSRCLEHWKDVEFPVPGAALQTATAAAALETAIIADASHMSVVEEPQRVIEAVYLFIAKLEGLGLG
mgnify:CR=1 FL=1